MRAWIACLAALPACGLIASAEAPGCGLDTDCPAGRVCTPVGCVTAESSALVGFAMDIQVVSSQYRVQRTDLDAAVLPRSGVVLDAPTTTDYSVIDANFEQAPAEVVLTRSTSIPGRPPHVSDTYLSGTGRLELAPGSYSAIITPFDDALAATAAPFEVTPFSNGTANEFQLRAPTRRILGRALYDHSGEGVPGVRVRAHSKTLGLRSTEATTDAAGRYQIDLPVVDDSAFVLTANFGTRPRLSVSQPVAFFGGESVATVNVEFAKPPPEQTMRSPAIRVLDALGTPLANVEVRLVGTGTSSDFVHEIEGTTDAEGRFLAAGPAGLEPVRLLAIPYAVAILPTFGIDARRTEGLTLGAEADALTINVLGRTRVTMDLIGVPTGWLGTAEFEALDGGATSGAAVTDPATNRAELFLDPGPYLVTLTPSDGAYPGSFQVLNIPDAATYSGTARLPAPSLLEFRIQFDDGSARELLVGLYQTVSEDRSVQIASAHGITGGIFTFVIPSEASRFEWSAN